MLSGQAQTAVDWSSRQLHFVGIGGAGMSGLALIAKALGARVTGSDRAGSSYTALPGRKRDRPDPRARARECPSGRRGGLLERDPAGQPRAWRRCA